MQRKYRPTIKTLDLWMEAANHVGSERHCSLIDQIAACLSIDDEELLVRLKARGNDQSTVAADMNVSQQAVSARYRRILNRANRCRPCGANCACSCHGRNRDVSTEGSSTSRRDVPSVLPERGDSRPESAPEDQAA